MEVVDVPLEVAEEDAPAAVVAVAEAAAAVGAGRNGQPAWTLAPTVTSKKKGL